MLVETLLSATLLVIGGLGVAAFMHRALKGASIRNELLKPRCKQPQCNAGIDVIECRCENMSVLVIK